MKEWDLEIAAPDKTQKQSLIVNVTIEVGNTTAVFTTELGQLGDKLTKVLLRMKFPQYPIRRIEITT
jgi:hypothetical protein